MNSLTTYEKLTTEHSPRLSPPIGEIVAADPAIETVLMNATSARRARHGVGRVRPNVGARLARQLRGLVGPGRWKRHTVLSTPAALAVALAELRRRLDGEPGSRGSTT